MQNFVDQGCQGFQLEGLLERRKISKFFRHAFRTIAGCENDRAPPRPDQLGNWRNQLAFEIYVEDSEVEVSGLRELRCLFDVAAFDSLGRMIGRSPTVQVE